MPTRMVWIMMMIAMMAMVMITRVSSDTITWTLPRANTQFMGGSKATLSWTSDYSSSTQMCIDLIDIAGATNTSVVTNIYNTGSYAWSSPVLTGSYQLAIQVCNTSAAPIFISSVFIMTGTDAQYLRFEYPMDRLSVASPFTSAPRQLTEGQRVQFTVGIPNSIYTNGYGLFNVTLWKYSRIYGYPTSLSYVTTIASGIVPSSAHQNITWTVTSGGACVTLKPTDADYFIRVASDSPQYYSSLGDVSDAYSVAFRITIPLSAWSRLVTVYPEPGLTFTRSATMSVQYMWQTPTFDGSISFGVNAGPERGGFLATPSTVNSCAGTVTVPIDTRFVLYSYVTLYYYRTSDNYPLGNTTYALDGVPQSRLSFTFGSGYYGGTSGFGSVSWSVAYSGDSQFAANRIDWVNIDLVTPTNVTIRVATKQGTWSSRSGSYYQSRVQTALRPELQALSSGTGYTIIVTNWAQPSERAAQAASWLGPTGYTIPVDVKYRVTIRTDWTSGNYYTQLNLIRDVYRTSMANILGVPDTWIGTTVGSVSNLEAYGILYGIYFDVVGPINDTLSNPTTVQKLLETTGAYQAVDKFYQLTINNASLFSGYPTLQLYDVMISQVNWLRCTDTAGVAYRSESCSSSSSSAALAAGAIVGIVFGVFFFIICVCVILAVVSNGVVFGGVACCCYHASRRRQHKTNILAMGVVAAGTPQPQGNVVYLAQPVMAPGPVQSSGANSQYAGAGGYSQPQYAGAPQYAHAPAAAAAGVAPSYSQIVGQQQPQQAPSYAAIQAARADQPRVAVAALPVGGYAPPQASAPTYVAPGYGQPQPQAASAPTYVPQETNYQPQPVGAPGGAPAVNYGAPPSYDMPPPAYGAPMPHNDFVSTDKT